MLVPDRRNSDAIELAKFRSNPESTRTVQTPPRTTFYFAVSKRDIIETRLITKVVGIMVLTSGEYFT